MLFYVTHELSFSAMPAPLNISLEISAADLTGELSSRNHDVSFCAMSWQSMIIGDSINKAQSFNWAL